jgi:NAD+ kinase
LEQHAEVLMVDQQFQHDFADGKEDLVVVIGGDGSILQSARQMGWRQRPVLGVNVGRLGFLAAVSPEQFIEAWPEVCRGEFSISTHLMLQCQVFREDHCLATQVGLNEAAILGGPPYSMLQIDLYVDQELATTYNCDGLIVSTPIGSTAHNLSAGGPILHKDLQAFVISPISPHTLTMRPVVDTADRIFELVVRSPNESTSIVVDGRAVCRLEVGYRVRVSRSHSTFQLISLPGQNDYVTLREKLGWRGSPSGLHAPDS